MPNRCKAIIFDLDNTLIDFMKMKQLACRAAVDAMIRAGLKSDRKKALSLIFNLYDRYGYEYKEIFQALLREMTGSVDYGIVGAGIAAYRKTRESGLLVPYPKVRETLARLRKRGIRLAVVTDAPKIEAWIRLAAMGIQNEFDVVITYEDSKVKKPSTKPFLMALKKMKVRPEEAMVVGDSVTKDIEPGNKIGAVTVLAKYGEKKKNRKKFGNEKSARPSFQIKRFSDILKLV
ncbi:MAG: TIGR02253 family HAD-type hydrolase [Candidatus Micrarchaeota archaeon]|nr:TIGR02253 family HAD-type hydrolase [Candidatus Micrarchaeota archaeon]